jgi:hypothetical protein
MAEHATMSCDEFIDAAAAVALDAHELDELGRVEQHAANCPDCARHLQAFREVAAALGAALPQLEPPSALRGRLLDALRETDRRPREVVGGGQGTPVSRVDVAGRQTPIRRLRLSPAWLAAAASFLFSLLAIVWVASLQGQIVALQKDAQLARERAVRYDRVVEVLASEKLAIRRLQPVAQNVPSRGMVYMDPSSGTGMVMCQNLPPIEQGHAYQVWFVRGNERVSGGLLWPDGYGNGYTLIQVPTDLQSFESVGLTDEPGTGSQWPTTPRVIGTPLNATTQ